MRNIPLHFHICWGTGTLDWERHDTRAGAEESAEQLALPGEKYGIEAFDGKCPACKTGPYSEKRTIQD